MSRGEALVGVSNHGGWAVLVTVTRDGTLLDRRRVDLVDAELPKLPHHHDAQRLPLEEALALVERVRVSANHHAALALTAVAEAVSVRIVGIALRTCPPLPRTVAERLTDYRARNVADWVMYRKALAGAAEGRGWTVHWYERKTVFAAATEALPVEELDAHFPPGEGVGRAAVGHGSEAGDGGGDRGRPDASGIRLTHRMIRTDWTACCRARSVSVLPPCRAAD